MVPGKGQTLFEGLSVLRPGRYRPASSTRQFYAMHEPSASFRKTAIAVGAARCSVAPIDEDVARLLTISNDECRRSQAKSFAISAAGHERRDDGEPVAGPRVGRAGSHLDKGCRRGVERRAVGQGDGWVTETTDAVAKWVDENRETVTAAVTAAAAIAAGLVAATAAAVALAPAFAAVGTVVAGVVGAATAAVTAIASIGSAIIGAVASVAGFVVGVGGIAAAAALIVPAIKVAALAVVALAGAAVQAAIPFAVGATAVAGLTYAFLEFTDTGAAVKEVLGAIFDGDFAAAADALSGVLSGVQSDWAAAVAWFESIPGMIADAFRSALGPQIADDIATVMEATPMVMAARAGANNIRAVWDGAMGWVKSAVQSAADAINRVWQSIQDYVRGVVANVKETWGGISDAFQAGEIKLAASIAFAGLEVEWERANLAILRTWNSLKGFFVDGFHEIVRDGQIAFANLSSFVQKAWAAISTGGNVFDGDQQADAFAAQIVSPFQWIRTQISALTEYIVESFKRAGEAAGRLLMSGISSFTGISFGDVLGDFKAENAAAAAAATATANAAARRPGG